MVPQQITRSQVGGSHRTVLVVDDDAATRGLLTEWVRALGCSAEEACDADAAVNIVRSRRIDIALCDICMPGHDGVWLIDQLRRYSPHTAIVVATGLSRMPPSVTLAPGVAAYIVKPFAYDAFVTAIERAFALPRPRCSPPRLLSLPTPSQK